jgi:hypothetical protein
MANQKMDSRVRVTVYLDAQQHESLKALAGENVSGYIRMLVRQVIASALGVSREPESSVGDGPQVAAGVERTGTADPTYESNRAPAARRASPGTLPPGVVRGSRLPPADAPHPLRCPCSRCRAARKTKRPAPHKKSTSEPEPVSSSACVHGTARGYRCWRCGGIAKVGKSPEP